MDLKKRMLTLILAVCFCLMVVGCESTMQTVEKTDQWIKENMW